MVFHCFCTIILTNRKNDNGDTVFDYLLREIPDLKVELDVGWALYAGTDVVKLLKKYRDRIAIIHLKDINDGIVKENSKEFFTTVGEGSIPLEKILEEAQKIQLFESEYIIDQDDSKGDMLDSLRDGVNNIKKVFA